MPGRPPNPLALQLLKGADRKDPKRYREKKANQLVSGDIGGPPARWLIFHPDVGYQRAEKLRATWDNCCKMWPWMEYADRDALEDYCGWKVDKESGIKLSGAEISAMKSIRSELGGTGSGRARLGVRSPKSAASTKAGKAADPRQAFLARKFG